MKYKFYNLLLYCPMLVASSTVSGNTVFNVSGNVNINSPVNMPEPPNDIIGSVENM